MEAGAWNFIYISPVGDRGPEYLHNICCLQDALAANHTLKWEVGVPSDSVTPCTTKSTPPQHTHPGSLTAHPTTSSCQHPLVSSFGSYALFVFKRLLTGLFLCLSQNCGQNKKLHQHWPEFPFRDLGMFHWGERARSHFWMTRGKMCTDAHTNITQRNESCACILRAQQAGMLCGKGSSGKLL